ncbi:hypothetical protein [Romboutsia sp.]|uniref:hypothetical protein n=1 Tax=Romboutsia sp. TaxID=1965302 RepID=UPI003F3B58A8
MDNKDSSNKIEKYSNYSKQDGKDLTKIDKNRLRLKTSQNKICSNCNLESDEYSSYCKFCGNNNDEINKETKDKTIKFAGKDGIITGVAAVGILFIMALIIKIIVSIGFGELGSIINPLQIMMTLNLSSVNIQSSTMLGSGIISAKLGILVLAVFPIIAISLANLIFLRKKSTNQTISNIVVVGITYGTLMVFISLFASVGSNFRNLIEYGISIKLSYNMLSTFFNGCVIATSCTYLIGFKNKYKQGNIYLSAIDKVMKTIVLGCIFILIILVIVTISDRSYLSEIGLYGYSDKFSMATIVTQLAVYMWAFANFIPITIGTNVLSPFNILGSGLFIETKLIFFSMIAASLLVILIIGYKLKENYKENDNKPVIIFSISYALFMGTLSILTNIMIAGNISLFGSESLQASINMGFPLIATIIRCFIYSFLISLVGYKLNGTEK